MDNNNLLDDFLDSQLLQQIIDEDENFNKENMKTNNKQIFVSCKKTLDAERKIHIKEIEETKNTSEKNIKKGKKKQNKNNNEKLTIDEEIQKELINQNTKPKKKVIPYLIFTLNYLKIKLYEF